MFILRTQRLIFEFSIVCCWKKANFLGARRLTKTYEGTQNGLCFQRILLGLGIAKTKKKRHNIKGVTILQENSKLKKVKSK